MRKPTQTLDFWQFDVGLYDDGKVIDLNEKYGPLGEAVYFRILCYIAKSNGYYAELNDALILYIYRSIGSKWIRNRRIISEVISYCGVCGLFDVNLLSQSIITSCGIQRRWLYAKTKSRAKGYSTAKFWILDDESEPELSNHTENYDNCNNKADNCNKNTDIKERQYNTTEDNTIKHNVSQSEEKESDDSSDRTVFSDYLSHKNDLLSEGLNAKEMTLTECERQELLELMSPYTLNKYCIKLVEWIRQNRPITKQYDLIHKWYEEDFGKD